MQFGNGSIFGGWKPPVQQFPPPTLPTGMGNTPVQQMPIYPDEPLPTGASRGTPLPGQLPSTPVNPFSYTRPSTIPATGTGRGMMPAGGNTTTRPPTPAQPPNPGTGAFPNGFQPPQPLGLTQSLYNWINSPGANWQTFQNMYGPQAADLWFQGRNFGGDVNALPTYDPGLSGGWAKQAGSGTWGYNQPGMGGGGAQQFQQFAPQGQQAPPMQQPQNPMGYQPPSQSPYNGGYGQGVGYGAGGFGGGMQGQQQYGGGNYGGYGYGGAAGYGGMQSMYGNSGRSWWDDHGNIGNARFDPRRTASGMAQWSPQILQLLQQLLGGY